MRLYELLLDELDQVPPDTQPTEFLVNPSVLAVLRAEIYDDALAVVAPIPCGHVATLYDIPLTVTEDVAFAAVRFR